MAVCAGWQSEVDAATAMCAASNAMCYTCHRVLSRRVCLSLQVNNGIPCVG